MGEYDPNLHEAPTPELASHPLFSGSTTVGIMSGERPRYPVGVPGENAAIKKHLDSWGLRYEDAPGHYGLPENSLVIYGPNREQMYHLGKRFGQESVIYSEGHPKHELIYTNGENEGKFHPGLKQYWYHPTNAPDDNYTKLPDRGYLRLHFDWDNKLDSVLKFERPGIIKSEYSIKEVVAFIATTLKKSVSSDKPHPHSYPWHNPHINHYVRTSGSGVLAHPETLEFAMRGAPFEKGEPLPSEWAYHGTKAENISAIKARGLIPGAWPQFTDKYSEYDDGKHLFFSHTPENASNFGEALLRFSWPKDSKADQNKFGRVLGSAFVTKSSIPAKNIEMWTGGEWRSLSSLQKAEPVVNEQAAGAGAGTFHAFMTPFGNVDKTSSSNLLHYPLHGRLKDIDKLVADHGYSVYYAGGKHGKPDLANKNYGTKSLMIYAPEEGSGGDFGHRDYTDAWRKSHELAHALTYPEVNSLYGEGRRIGKLGHHRTLREALRAVHWEDLAVKKQRELLGSIGINISDGDYNKERNTVLGDAAHRAVTGQFLEPSAEGFRPYDHEVPLSTALGLVRNHAQKLGLKHDHDLLQKNDRSVDMQEVAGALTLLLKRFVGR